MIRSILACLAALLGGAALYFFYPGYLSFYLFLFILCLPILSVLLSLPRRRRYRLRLEPAAASACRGEELSLRLLLSGPAETPLALRLRVENLLYPQESRVERCALTPGVPLTLPLPTRHCGWLRITPLRCTLRDRLGLIPIPIPLPQSVLTLVLPPEAPLPPLPQLAPQPGSPLRPRPGGGPGEDYELRPYRPGDPVAAIHWKLTAKQPGDEPILRETLEPVRDALAVSYDHFGDPDGLDNVLGQLAHLARLLLETSRPFTLCWAHPVTGAVTFYDIDCPAAWERCWRALAAQSAPAQGRSLAPEAAALPRCRGPVRWIRLEPREEVEEP